MQKKKEVYVFHHMWPPRGLLPSKTCFSTRTCPYPVTLLPIGSPLFSSQTFSCINTPTFLKPNHTSYPPAYKDATDSVPKRRHIKFRRRGNYPEESIEVTATFKTLLPPYLSTGSNLSFRPTRYLAFHYHNLCPRIVLFSRKILCGCLLSVLANCQNGAF